MIAIVDYGVGNLRSVQNMFKRVGVDSALVREPDAISSAEALLLPGVGHFATCMERFRESGLKEVVQDSVFQRRVPILGICVGAQMMTRSSEEGDCAGLGWVPADTIRFRLNRGSSLKVPHMGWSDLIQTRESLLWRALPEEPRFYFAHSFHFSFDDESAIIGKVDYGSCVACAFEQENIFGVQFHPEKSHRYGMQVFKNFAESVQR